MTYYDMAKQMNTDLLDYMDGIIDKVNYTARQVLMNGNVNIFHHVFVEYKSVNGCTRSLTFVGYTRKIRNIYDSSSGISRVLGYIDSHHAFDFIPRERTVNATDILYHNFLSHCICAIEDFVGCSISEFTYDNFHNDFWHFPCIP